MYVDELESLRSILISKLVVHVGPIAHILVRDATKSLEGQRSERISIVHIIAVLRQLQTLLPDSVDSDRIVTELRAQLIGNRI